MHILGHDGISYLFLNGISVPEPIALSERVELFPVSCAPNPDWITSHAKSETDVGVMAIFLRHVHSELKICESDAIQHAALAWNSVWDAMLLSALFDCHAVCNFQCSNSAANLSDEALIQITNYQFRGFSPQPYMLSADQCSWVKRNFDQARKMLDNPAFQNAVHCSASYRWHSLPRARLALLWAGIEGLFGVDSELSFRISLYAARFLNPDDDVTRRDEFKRMKKLYGHRSKAVHGSNMKGKPQELVAESAELLTRLISACVEQGELPDAEKLAP